MTGYRIGLTKIRDFLPFEKAEFDFSQPGLTVVEGEIVGMMGCDSNGSGKSALIEAPVWALTGRCIRERYKGDDVVRLGAKTGACVEVNLTGGEKDIRVVRYRKDKKHKDNVYLYVNGENVSAGTNRATDLRIERELGLDFDTFMNTVAFGARAEVRSFFFATDAERKRIMDKLLGLEAFAKAQTIAKTRLRDLTREIDPLMTAEMNLGLKVQADKASIERLRLQVDVDPVDLNDARLRVRALSRRRDQLIADVAQAEDDLREAESAHRDVMRAYDRSVDGYEASKRRFEKASVAHRRDARDASLEASRLKREASKLVTLRGKKCPTCRQQVAGKTVKEIVDSMRGEAANYEGKAAAEIAEAETVEAEIAGLEVPVEPACWDLRTAEEILAKRKEDLAGCRADLREAQARLDALEEAHNRTAGQIEALEAEIETDEQSLTDIRIKQEDIKDKLARLEFWADAFGNGGLKSYVIEAELPTINKLATGFARRLLGEGAHVRLQPTKELKTRDEVREEMVVDAAIPGCTASYAGASKGQRHRLDLSMILAFREVVSHRSAAAFDQLVADELFDGVDATGIDCVIEILQEVAATCPVLLVTHDARLKSVGQRLVTVRHEGGKATLVAS